jgi:hypothetical protein
MALRILGIVLFSFALWAYFRGFYAVGNGDFHFSINYKGVGTLSNRDWDLFLILALGGIIAFGLSFPSNERTDDDEKG